MPALEQAAFGDRPDLVITARPAQPRDRWLAAVVLGGQGRYAAAAVLLDELIAGRDPVLAAFAASTLASHRRQLGGHAAARVLDATGLHRLATAGRFPAAPARTCCSGSPPTPSAPAGSTRRGGWSPPPPG